jgi:hypothetical protein
LDEEEEKLAVAATFGHLPNMLRSQKMSKLNRRKVILSLKKHLY